MDNKKERVLFFDTGPIITLVMSRLIWILPKLKEKFGGKFYITPAVKRELITRPLQIKRFEFEALQAMKLIEDGILEVYDAVPQKRVNEFIGIANSTFKVRNKTMDIIQEGEMQSLAAALEINAEAIVMDERTLRLFVENNQQMKKLLEMRFNAPVAVDQMKLKQFSDRLKSIKIIRSLELVGIAFKMGLLNGYIPKQKGGKELLVDSVLWAVKYNGAAVTEQEIDDAKEFLIKNK